MGGEGGGKTGRKQKSKAGKGRGEGKTGRKKEKEKGEEEQT